MKQALNMPCINFPAEDLLVNDKTPRDPLHESLDLEEEIAQERLQAAAEMVAGITHHFNNIFQGIIGSAELARLHANASDSIEEDLARIVQQSREAAHLIQQLLDFSRQTIAEKQWIDLVPLVKKTITELKLIFPENIEFSLTVEPEHEMYILRADSRQIQQALTNLARNAQEAMPGGGTLRFHLTTLGLDSDEKPFFSEMSVNRCLALSISDTGTGIPPEVRPYIFEPFFTTKDVGQGTGLGLAQVYGIVKQHHGDIEVTTRVGRGTTFTLYLPILPGYTKRSTN